MKSSTFMFYVRSFFFFKGWVTRRNKNTSNQTNKTSYISQLLAQVLEGGWRGVTTPPGGVGARMS